MTDKTVDDRCKCGHPATVRQDYGPPKCLMCHLVDTYASAPPRKSPGNIGDSEVRHWMRRILKKAFTEMVSLMRADLDDLATKWNPPPDNSTQEGNQQAASKEP